MTATAPATPVVTHVLADTFSPVGDTRPTVCGEQVRIGLAAHPCHPGEVARVTCPRCREENQR